MISLRQRAYTLELQRTFRVSRGASDVRENLFVEIECEGTIGLGEAAPIARYAQSCTTAARAVEQMVGRIRNPRAFSQAVEEVWVAGQPAAAAAVDMALWDLAGKRLGVPVYELLGVDPATIPPTSFTIGIDDPETIARKVDEAEPFAVLKVKLGSSDDKALLSAVRRVTDRPLRVDANEGWSFEEARANLVWLADMGVELVEQPLPAARLEEMGTLRKISPLPLIADESVANAADIPALANAFDGINIKLMKCGGLSEARRMIDVARAHGLRVMLGCMVESSLAITAASHLAPLVDWTDLDGHLLIRNDPFVGCLLLDGSVVPPPAPGLGVRTRAGAEI